MTKPHTEDKYPEPSDSAIPDSRDQWVFWRFYTKGRWFSVLRSQCLSGLLNQDYDMRTTLFSHLALVSFLSNWQKLGSSGRRSPELGKCPQQTGLLANLYGISVIHDWYEGPVHLGGATSGQVVLGSTSNQAEQAMRVLASKQHPPWPLYQCRVPVLFEFLPSLPPVMDCAVES